MGAQGCYPTGVEADRVKRAGLRVQVGKLAGVILLALNVSLYARQGSVVRLDEILQRLQQNLDTYDQSIPSFFCNEHLDSMVEQIGARGSSAPNYETIAESIFRLKREDPTGKAQEMTESREVIQLNGKPPRPGEGEDLNAPYMFTGAFSGGLSVVSLEQKECMRYTLERPRVGKPYVVRFTTAPAAERTERCILQEDGSGFVEVDPASMQITHLELRAPHHAIRPQGFGGGRFKNNDGTWFIAVDYAPVVLDQRTFWLPKRIVSRTAMKWTRWTFDATYRNYHKLEVTTRILPADGNAP